MKVEFETQKAFTAEEVKEIQEALARLADTLTKHELKKLISKIKQPNGLNKLRVFL